MPAHFIGSWAALLDLIINILPGTVNCENSTVFCSHHISDRSDYFDHDSCIHTDTKSYVKDVIESDK